MKIIRPDLLLDFRGARKCGYCGRPMPSGCHPHHLHTRATGRLDVRVNLLSVCPWDHTAIHAGYIPRCELVALVAARERMTFGDDDLLAVVWLIRRAPLTANRAWFVNESVNINEELLDSVLKEIGL